MLALCACRTSCLSSGRARDSMEVERGLSGWTCAVTLVIRLFLTVMEIWIGPHRSCSATAPVYLCDVAAKAGALVRTLPAVTAAKVKGRTRRLNEVCAIA